MQPRDLGDLRRVVGELVDVELAQEQLADLGAAAVDRGHEDVRLAIVGELHDQLGEVRLHRAYAGSGKGIVELDLVRGQRFHLHHLVGAVVAYQPRHHAVCLVGVARPVHVAARSLHSPLDLLEVVVQVTQRALLERPPRLAERLPVRQLLDDRRALGPDRARGVPEVAAKLSIPERRARRLGERGAPVRAHAAGASSVEARISAR